MCYNILKLYNMVIINIYKKLNNTKCNFILKLCLLSLTFNKLGSIINYKQQEQSPTMVSLLYK
jgi:hypothetical protein